MEENYNLGRIFHSMLMELVKSDDLYQSERILLELDELVPDIMQNSLILVNNMDYYCTKLNNNYILSNDLHKQIFTFKMDEEYHSTIGYCSCPEFIDSVLMDEISLTCQHELAIAIICYMSKLQIKMHREIHNHDKTNKFGYVKELSFEDYIKLLNNACDNDNC